MYIIPSTLVDQRLRLGIWASDCDWTGVSDREALAAHPAWIAVLFEHRRTEDERRGSMQPPGHSGILVREQGHFGDLAHYALPEPQRRRCQRHRADLVHGPLAHEDVEFAVAAGSDAFQVVMQFVILVNAL